MENNINLSSEHTSWIDREECPNGHWTHPSWAFCAICGAEFVMVRYLPARVTAVPVEAEESDR